MAVSANLVGKIGNQFIRVVCDKRSERTKEQQFEKGNEYYFEKKRIDRHQFYLANVVKYILKITKN